MFNMEASAGTMNADEDLSVDSCPPSLPKNPAQILVEYRSNISKKRES
jgi:hypothetical protein